CWPSKRSRACCWSGGGSGVIPRNGHGRCGRTRCRWREVSSCSGRGGRGGRHRDKLGGGPSQLLSGERGRPCPESGRNSGGAGVAVPPAPPVREREVVSPAHAQLTRTVIACTLPTKLLSPL